MTSEAPHDGETDIDLDDTQEGHLEDAEAEDAETEDAEAEQVALAQSDSRVWVPSFDLLTMVAGFAMQNPGMVFTVGLKALFDYWRPSPVDILSNEVKCFMAESLIWRDGCDEKYSQLEEKVAALASAIGEQPNLTGSEVVAVLDIVRSVYERSLDPEKRQLVAAALRSCLLNREKFRGGLRVRYLSMLAQLTFSDIVALAAIVYRDENLAELVGLSVNINPTRVLVDPAARVQMHITPLKECGLVISDGSNTTAGLRNFWGATETAEGFLQFLEANSETLERLASAAAAPTP